MGVKVKIMLPYDPNGKVGIKKQLPDLIILKEQKTVDKEEEIRTTAPVQQPATETPKE